jgi:Cof subfamily protein (haloacid dehalogenase superfamily)
MNSHWKILACDLDGTLIGWDRKINEADLEALRQARDAGFHIAICTGRNSRESTRVTAALGLTGLGVFANGAMVADMSTSATVDSQPIDDAAVDEAVAFFAARRHPVLLLADDPDTRQPEYYLTTHGPAHRATVDWLLVNRVGSRPVDGVPVAIRGRIVRLGIVTEVAESVQIHDDLERLFAGRATTHSIYSPTYDCQILEFFRHGTTKWSGIEHLARVMNLSADSVIAVGDDVNDIDMLRGAKLSFAMGDARPDVKAAAKRVTAAQADCGLAMMIEQLLAGELEPRHQGSNP